MNRKNVIHPDSQPIRNPMWALAIIYLMLEHFQGSDFVKGIFACLGAAWFLVWLINFTLVQKWVKLDDLIDARLKQHDEDKKK